MKSLLSGVKILDVTRMLAGPFGSMLMGDLGADVIKVESPRGGDISRDTTDVRIGGESPYFLSINRNKRGITLDLTKARGREILYSLARKVDVFFENFRPEVAQKLGCDYATIRQINPRVIHCSLSGFGSGGPYRDRPAFDLVVQAMGGGMSLTGEPGRPPVRMGLPMGDLSGGLFAVFAIAAALYHRERTGRGTWLDISLVDCQVSLLSYVAQGYFLNGTVPEPVGSAHPFLTPYQAFPTQDGYVVVAVVTEKFWKIFCKAIEREDLAQDPAYETVAQRQAKRPVLLPLLEEILRSRTTCEWLKTFDEHGIPAAPVHRVDEILNDPQIIHRKMVVEIDHPAHGRYRAVGNPIKSSEAQGERYSAPPTLGQHNAEVLSEYLGMTEEEVKALAEDGVI